MVDGYDPAAADAGVGGEVSEVREPRHGAGAATGATELPGTEPAEESRRGAPPRRHGSQRDRERDGQRHRRREGKEMAGRH